MDYRYPWGDVGVYLPESHHHFFKSPMHIDGVLMARKADDPTFDLVTGPYLRGLENAPETERYLREQTFAFDRLGAGRQPLSLFDGAKALAPNAVRAFIDRTHTDKAQVRIILHSDRGDQMAAHVFAGDVMAQVSRDLRKPIDWIGVTHRLTPANVHTHIVVRGEVIEHRSLRRQLFHGVVNHAWAISQARFELLTEQAIAERYEHDILRRDLTGLDLFLQRVSHHHRVLLDTLGHHRVVTQTIPERYVGSFRDALSGRLHELARRNLAVHIRGNAWGLDPHLVSHLRLHAQLRSIATDWAERTGAHPVMVPYDATHPQHHRLFGMVHSRMLADQLTNRELLLVASLRPDMQLDTAKPWVAVPVRSGVEHHPSQTGDIVMIRPQRDLATATLMPKVIHTGKDITEMTPAESAIFRIRWMSRMQEREPWEHALGL